jgi:antitoxin component YwqK of YwqJK toxin-antitoxin module
LTGDQKGKSKNGRNYSAWTYYWENGQLLFEGTYKDGKRVGPWVDYFKDGTVDEEYTGTFRVDVNVKLPVIVNPPDW